MKAVIMITHEEYEKYLTLSIIQYMRNKNIYLTIKNKKETEDNKNNG